MTQGATAIALRHLAAAPDDAAAWHAAARALDRAGRYEDAFTAIAEAFRLAPNDPGIHARHARALIEHGARRRLAHEPAQRAVRLDLAQRLRGRHRPAAARDILLPMRNEEHGIEAAGSLALCALEMGDQDEARREIERALACRPDDVSLHQLRCDIMAYQDGVTGADLTRALERRAASRPRAQAIARAGRGARDPGRRLRLGLLGGGFWRHPTTWLTLAAFEHMDPSLFDIHCFASSGPDDEFTARWRRIASDWHDIGDRETSAIATRIRDAGIDILIDLGGSLAQGSLAAMALRPAPVQVKWVGAQYHTTGMAEVDAFVTDDFETPAGLAHLYRERLLIMPGSYVCYDPPRDAPAVVPPPASVHDGRAVTFGSFNSLMKITPRTIDTWSAILHGVPGSRLFAKTPQFEEDAVRDAVLAAFAAHGIAAGRIDLEGESDHRGVLAAYGRVDIALQPFPYCGGVTLLEGLFMGVPSIALTGESFAARHGVSHLSNVGLSDFVAADTGDYVAKAIDLALSPSRLTELRGALRDRLLRGPICDAPGFSSRLAHALDALHASLC